MRPLARTFRPLSTARRLLAATALAGSLAASGCGEPEPEPNTFPADEAGWRLGVAAGDVSQLIEDALGAASIVTEAGITQSGAAAASSIGWLLGECATAKATPTNAKAVEIAFAEGGCGVPTTRLSFGGALAGGVEASGAITVRFSSLTSGSRTLDGSIVLTPISPLQYRFQIQGLQVTDRDRRVVLDANGSASITTDHVRFNAAGAFAEDGRRFVFEAKDVARSFSGDCYPEGGTVTIVESTDATALSASIRYDEAQFGLVSSETGMVGLYYRDASGPFAVRGRICK